MFKISKKGKISWSIDDLIKEHVLYFADNLFISKEYLESTFPEEAIIFNEQSINEITYFSFRSKKWINIDSINNYESFQKLFYLNIWCNEELILETKNKIFKNKEVTKLILDSCSYSATLDIFDIRIAATLIGLEDSKSYYNIPKNGLIYISKDKLKLIIKDISNSNFKFEMDRIKLDLVVNFQKEIIKIKEVIQNDKLASEVCSSKIVFDQLIELKMLLIEKFIIYISIFNNRNITDSYYPSFYTDNFESFKNKYTKYKINGYRVLKHGNFFNGNAKIPIEPKYFQILKKLYSDGKKWSYRQISKEVNTLRILDGKKPLSKQTYINIIKNDLDFMTMYMVRYGDEELDKFLPHPRRLKPTEILSVIQMDGCRINILTKDSSNKLVFYYLVVALDVYSNKIVGYKLVNMENLESYFEIIKGVIKSNFVYPKEIVVDNLRSLTSNKAKDFFNRLNTIGVKVRFHKANNPQDKAQVENWFRIFNKLYLKKVDGFLGEGIKSKNKDARPNDLILKANRNPKNAMDEASLQSLIDQQISLYNNNYKTTENTLTPNNEFNLEYPNSDLRTNFEEIYRYLFYNELKVYLNKSYISITINGKIHEYMFYDDSYDFLKLHFKKYIYLRLDKDNPEKLFLYSSKHSIKSIITLTLYKSIPMASHEMTKEHLSNAYFHSSHSKKVKDLLQEDIKGLRKSILEFDVHKKKDKSNLIYNKIKLEKIPTDLLNEKFDSKELIKVSAENEYRDKNDDQIISMLKNMKLLFKMKGSNDLIN